MQFQYGAPAPTLAERPRCWSKAFDEGARECRGCGFQTSCKEEILRMNQSRPLAAPAPQQFVQQYQPYAVPQPVQVVHHPAPQPMQQLVPQFRGLQPAPVSQQPQLQPQQLLQRPAPPIHPVPAQQYGYGWIQDPMYYALTSAPPPMRPQMGDESFFDRVVKNTGLAMLESFFGQCLLAVRQMVLPPSPRIVEIEVQQQQQLPEAPRQ